MAAVYKLAPRMRPPLRDRRFAEDDRLRSWILSHPALDRDLYELLLAQRPRR